MTFFLCVFLKGVHGSKVPLVRGEERGGKKKGLEKIINRVG